MTNSSGSGPGRELPLTKAAALARTALATDRTPIISSTPNLSPLARFLADEEPEDGESKIAVGFYETTLGSLRRARSSQPAAVLRGPLPADDTIELTLELGNALGKRYWSQAFGWTGGRVGLVLDASESGWMVECYVKGGGTQGYGVLVLRLQHPSDNGLVARMTADKRQAVFRGRLPAVPAWQTILLRSEFWVPSGEAA